MSHGVTIREQPTGVKPAAHVDAGLPVYVGTAPINSVDLTNVNKANLVSSLAEAVAVVGALSSDFASWTLHEAVKAHFSVYGIGPIVLINVLDPANSRHKANVTAESHQLVQGTVLLQVYGGPDAPMLGILESTVVVKNQAGNHTYILGTDYTLAFDDSGFLALTRTTTGGIGASDILMVDFSYLDPTGVTTNDIIGGYSAGKYTGLEVVRQVFPALRKVGGLILAPKYSSTPTIAARMAALAHSVNGAFRCMALTDLSTDPGAIPTYAEAGAWKTSNGYTSVDQAACWPKGKNGDDVYHGSTIMACVANLTDATVNGVPYVSPSNKPVTITAAVLDDGTEVLLETPQANTLNDSGIVTFLNGFNGWVLWGNRTAGYPGTTDPKDAFISIRRFFNWMENTIVLTTAVNVDGPVNLRLISSVRGTLGSFLNARVAEGALIDGKIEFRKDENPTTELADGHVVWHVTATPPSPGEQLEFVPEYDPSALDKLFT